CWTPPSSGRRSGPSPTAATARSCSSSWWATPSGAPPPPCCASSSAWSPAPSAAAIWPTRDGRPGGDGYPGGRPGGDGYPGGRRRSPAAVVRCMLGDRDVVRMRLAQAGAGDAHEAGVRLHVRDRRRAAVAHGHAQPADQLVQHVGDRALLGDTALDALGDQLVGVVDLALEVAVLGVRAALHRPHRPHAPVLLEPLALVEHDLA